MSRLITLTLVCCILLAQSVVAQEYTVKPGDLITVTVWERQTLSSTVTVDVNGNITLPVPIGSMSVAGLTAQQISDLLTERLKEFIINPTIFVSVTPAQTFTVHIIGEVVSPNFYNVPDGTSIQELITRAGGLTQFADIKRIKLIRKVAADGLRPEENADKDSSTASAVDSPAADAAGSAKERVIDFSLFRDKAELSANPTLKANDVVVIPRLSDVKPVHIMGAVSNPGVVTIEKTSPLIEVIFSAGGFSDAADLKQISILSLSDGKYSFREINFEKFLAGEDLTVTPQVSPGEAVFVPKLELEKKRILVYVVGQVTNPGGCQIAEGDRLFDALFAAKGFADEAAIDKITIIHSQQRKASSDGTAEMSSVKTEVNLQNFLTTGYLKDNPQLAKSDIVIVPIKEGAKGIIPPMNSPFFPTIRIKIFGEVANPNTYQISSDSNLLDILRLAGGPTDNADLRRVMIIREKANSEIRNPKSEIRGGKAMKEQPLQVDIERVLMEGELKLLPPLLTDDTIFVPKRRPKRRIWSTLVRTAADISTIAVAVILITTGRRYY